MLVSDKPYIDGIVVGSTIPLGLKIHEISQETRRLHGKNLKFDGEIIRGCLKRDVGKTALMAVVAGVTFGTCSWVHRISGVDNTPSRSL